ncbi:MAG TPA: hypothetical protein VG248_15845 [Caulobacteraceae bacterium]|jgi:hypothetical protein|nr:hypothetical protein [Caulobacteraceae bacterium]
MPNRHAALPLMSLSLDAWRLALDSWSVITLRTAGAMSGEQGQAAEASLMVTEKAQALIDAQFLIARSVMSGEAHLAAPRALALYRRRVQANRRRLTRPSKS